MNDGVLNEKHIKKKLNNQKSFSSIVSKKKISTLKTENNQKSIDNLTNKQQRKQNKENYLVIKFKILLF